MNIINRKSQATSIRRYSLSYSQVGMQKWRQGKHVSRKDMDEFDENCSEQESGCSSFDDNEDDLEEELFGKKSLTAIKSDQDTEVCLTRKQTLILSSLLPDEILTLEKYESLSTRCLVGVLLMADVSGYTALSEKYASTGKGGTYRLTFTLNTYLGGLIELIYSHGGDVIKFAGDAFLALWKTDKSSFICHTIHNVVACALIIQHSYATYETDVKVNLKVKLAIAAGNLIFTPIGKGNDMNYIVFGLPVIEAKLAESLCVSGEVKLTPSAWGHCYSRNYDYILHEDGHVTIRAILYDPREKDVCKPFAGIGTLLKSRKTYTAIEQLPDCLLDNPNKLNAADLLKKTEALSLRKSVLVAEERNIGSEFRKFMIRPILTQIDAHQPLEYLTEMRQVSILFMTLKPMECPYMQLITIVNNSYEITCDIVYRSMGCVNKIILFDKDVMILVVFGLRGFKHESEAAAALKCAHSIKKSVSALAGVKEMSIGVTTGQVYCGVVGHPLRREFTVIGAIVNKAARLMCGYRNRITCDEATFVKSKMSKNGFTLQPPIELKGISDPGKIYDYSEEVRMQEMFDIKIIPPLLERTDEIEYFERWLQDSSKNYRDFDALMLVGEPRTGKSRLLEWMARCAKNKGYKICTVNLTSIHSATPYLALSQIVNQILMIEEPVEGFAKEEKIINLLKVYSEDLCFLNHIIKVRFAFHEGMSALAESQRMQKAKHVFARLISCIDETHVIFLDDLQNLDSSTWELIAVMMNFQKIFIVFSVTKRKFTNDHEWLFDVFTCQNIRKIMLGSLSNETVAALACQVLGVDAVSSDLVKVLKAKCKGVPGIIENFILNMFSNGVLDIQKVNREEIESYDDQDYHFPPSQLLHPQALNIKEQGYLDECITNNATDEITICTVPQKELLKTNIDAQNVEAQFMVQVDTLTPYQQLLIKIASVIGNVFARVLLENIMYANNPLTTAKAIKRLFALRMITCANNRASMTCRKSSTNSTGSSAPAQKEKCVCECNFEHDPDENDHLPKYAFCKLMRFKNYNMKKTCYELLPMNQKKEFHSRIVAYLESNKQKCRNCGGSVMISESVEHLDVPAQTSEVTVFHRKTESSSSSSEEEVMFPRPSSLNKDSSFRLDHREVYNKSDDNRKRVTMPSVSYKESFFRKLSLATVDSNNQTNTENAEKPKKLFELFRPVLEASHTSDWQQLGIDTVDMFSKNEAPTNKFCSFQVKLEKDLSKMVFEKCTCAELDIIILDQLIFHAEQAELRRKVVEFQVKFAYLNILSNIPDLAIPKLLEAEVYCAFKTNSDFSSFERRRYKAKILTLKAAAYLQKENYADAKTNIEKANKIYHINNKRLIKLNQVIRNAKFKLRLRKDHAEMMLIDSLYCLNVACVLYSSLRDEKCTLASTQMALDIVKKVDCDLPEAFETFSNAMQIQLDRGSPANVTEIECIATEYFKKVKKPIKTEDLFSFGKLCLTAFKCRIARGSLNGAVRSGYRSVAITRFLSAHTISMEIIPELFYVLLSQGFIIPAIDLVKELLRMGQKRQDFECETWYYALCIDLILDAGCQLECPQLISRFAEYGMGKENVNPTGYRRLITGLWTYWLRAGVDRRARKFEDESLGLLGLQADNNNLTSLLTSMRLAEGMLESLARKVDDLRKVVNMMELRSLADAELSKIERDARICFAVHPRWLLLKANSYLLSGRTAAAINNFSLAQEEAKKLHNSLEADTARAETTTSNAWIQSAKSGYFIDYKKAKPIIDAGQWHTLMYRISR